MGKKFKRYLSVVLAAALLITNCPISVYAEENETVTETVLEEAAQEVALASSSDAKEVSIASSSDAEKETKIENADEEKEVEEESIKESVKEASPNDAEYDDVDFPAFNITSDSIDGVKVTVTAEEGVFPAGSKLAVKKIAKTNEDANDIEAAVDNAKLFADEEDDEDTTTESYTFDIKVLDKDSNEVQPKDDANVSVKFELVDNAQTITNAKVYHLEETDESKLAKLDALLEQAKEDEEDEFDYSLLDGEVIDNVTKKQNKINDTAAKLIQAQEEASNEAEEIEIKETAFVATELETEIKNDEESNVVVTTTDGFSYYVVEFYYGTYEYVLDGDSEVKLSVILKALGLDTVIDESKITKIEVSNNDLFTAVHRETALDSNEFVWYVIAKNAFDTTEKMTITADGVEYEIKVTDDSNLDALRADVQWHTGGESGSLYGVIGEKISAIINNNKTSIAACDWCKISISGDIEDYNIVIPSGAKNVSLDLNGHTIDAKSNGRILVVEEGATLTITGNGTLTNGYATSPGGGAIYNSGSLTLDNVSISNCHVYNSANQGVGLGGAICNDSKLYFNAGTISDCYVESSMAKYSRDGGGIYSGGSDETELIMTGGTVSNCYIMVTGGNHISNDVSLNYTGKAVISGGTVGTIKGTVYTTTLDANGGTPANVGATIGGKDNNIVVWNTDYTLPEISKDGSNFIGWGDETTTPATIYEKVGSATNGKTLTAQWEDIKPNYLTFTAEEAGATVFFDSFENTIIEYSLDGGNTWTEYSKTEYKKGKTFVLSSVGAEIKLRGEDVVTDEDCHFEIEGQVAASGSVTSLTDGIGGDPNVKLTESCYAYMFYDCTGLTTAPELPATTLEENCYNNMFNGCSSLNVGEKDSGDGFFKCPGSIPSSAVSNMFTGTGGSFTGTPTAGNTYYIEATTYKVTYDGNNASGGEAPTDDTKYTSGALVTVKGNTGSLAKTGYNFIGWNEDSSATTAQYVADDTFNISENTTLYAIWTKSQYTVTFDVQGHGTAPATQTIEYQGKVEEPTSPTETGYVFGGWYKESGCTNAWDFANDTVTGDTTLYAKWTKDQYTVTFDVQGHGTAPVSQSIEYQGKVAKPAPPAEAGYVFEGWYKEDTCDNAWDFASDIVTGDTTLYAKWTNAKYTVTLYGQGATTEGTSSVTATYLSAMPSATMPEKTGHTFLGYFDAPSDGKQYYKADGSSANDWDKTSASMLFAQWEAKEYNVTLDGQGATTAGTTSVMATYLSAMPQATMPEKTGYTFTGYFDQRSGGNMYYDADGKSASSWDKASVATLYAQWAANEYVISFDSHGGGDVAPMSGNYDTSITMPAGPTKDNYHFAGWNTAADGTGVTYPAGSSYPITGEATLHAMWSANQYTLTFDTKGGSTVDPMTRSFASEVTLPAAPTKTGYTFNNWNTEADGSGDKYEASGSYTMQGSATLYAQWDANEYTVTLDNKGATEKGTESVTATYDSAMPSATMPTKTGYTFKGYFDAVTGGKQYYKADGTSANEWDKTSATTLHAQWEANKYTVTLNSQGATTPGTASVEATYDSAMPVATMPIKAGHTFQGYFDATSGGEMYYNADGSSAKSWDKTSETTLYAQWTINNYTVTFDGNGHGGTTIPASQNHNYGEKVVRPTVTPSQIGYTFGGWFKETECTNEWDFDVDTVQDDTVLHAKWSINNYTITFDSQGGESVDPITAEYYSYINVPAAPKREGYIFLGWNTTADGKGVLYPENTEYQVMDDAKLYGKWSAEQFKLTFVTNCEEIVNPIADNYSTIVKMPAAPSKTGHTFKEWNTKNDGTGEGKAALSEYTIRGNATFYGIWNVNKYAVTFDVQGHGTAPASQSIDYQGKVTKPASPSEAGYVFEGWYKESTCENEWDFANDKITDVTTLYADWSKAQYTITLDSQGATTPGTANVTATYLEEMPSATMPVKTDYSFLGYYDAIEEGTKYYNADGSSAKNWDKTSAATLYAHWEIDKTVAINTRTGKKYETVQAAVDDNETVSGDTIQLTKSVDVGYLVGGLQILNKDLTLDLNGFNIDGWIGVGFENGVMKSSSSTTKLTFAGTSSDNANNVCIEVYGATVDIDGGTWYEHQYTKLYSNVSFVNVYKGATLNMRGGTYTGRIYSDGTVNTTGSTTVYGQFYAPASGLTMSIKEDYKTTGTGKFNLDGTSINEYPEKIGQAAIYLEGSAEVVAENVTIAEECLIGSSSAMTFKSGAVPDTRTPIQVQTNGHLIVEGGEIKGKIILTGKAIADVKGGRIDNLITASGNSHINAIGGTLALGLSMSDTSGLTVSGGTIYDTITVHTGCSLNVESGNLGDATKTYLVSFPNGADTATVNLSGGTYYHSSPASWTGYTLAWHEGKMLEQATTIATEGYDSYVLVDTVAAIVNDSTGTVEATGSLADMYKLLVSGKTLKILGNIQDSKQELAIPLGATLDLNGKTLGCGAVGAIGDIKDSASGEGKLISSGTVTVSKDNVQIPIGTAATGYRFCNYLFKVHNKKLLEKETGDGRVRFQVSLQLQDANKKLYPKSPCYADIINGNGGLTYAMKMTWTHKEESKEYSFPFNDLLMTYASDQSKATSTKAMNIYYTVPTYNVDDTISTYGYVLSDTGWEKNCNTLTYTYVTDKPTANDANDN